MANMFTDSVSFDADLGQWDTSRVRSFAGFAQRASSFQGRGLANWNVSSGSEFGRFADGATKFNENLCTWRDTLSPDSSFVNPTTTFAAMFVETDCPDTRDPLNVTTGPFCYACND